MAATGNSCFWLADLKKSSPLKPLGQMNRNLIGSIYGRSSNFLDEYKKLNLCLCSHQCIRDVMMQRMQVSKFKRQFSTLHMGQKKSYVWDISNWLWLWCLVLSKLIDDSQNQNYLYLGTLIPFKLKVRS